MSKRKQAEAEEVIIIDSDSDDVGSIKIVSETANKKKQRPDEPQRKRFLHPDDEIYYNQMKANCKFFDYCDFSKATPMHRFIKQPSSMQPKAVIAVGKELAQLSSKEFVDGSLLTQSSCVFIRADMNRPALLRFMITGPSDTPYQNGTFVFDVQFPNNYPLKPPLVQLCTTGHGSVRFNPNLYNCGKVCLSLLGTWMAISAAEQWNKNSNLWQVILAIQSMIMIDYPFFNEPGFGQPSATLLNQDERLASSWSTRMLANIKLKEKNTIDLTVDKPVIRPLKDHLLTKSSIYYEKQMERANHDQKALQYNYNTRANCLNWAIIAHLKNPPTFFEKEVLTHFKYKASELMGPQKENWLSGQGANKVQSYFISLQKLLQDIKM